MNIVRIQVENPDELLAAGAFGAGAVVHVQSATSSGGPFSDIATPTYAIVTEVFEYTAYDPAGGATTWYRTRYENAGATVVSAWSAAFEPAVPVLYAAVPDAKRRLGIKDENTTDDDLLALFGSLVTDRITQYCGRQFAPNPGDGSTAQFLFDGWDVVDGGSIVDGGRTLLVPRGIVSLTTLEVATYTGAAFATIPTTDWFLGPPPAELTPGWPYEWISITNIPLNDPTPAFYPGFRTIRLTGILGWPACPPTINDIALTLVVASYRARGAGGGDRYEIDADGTRTFERMWSLADKRALDKFKLKQPVLI